MHHDHEYERKRQQVYILAHIEIIESGKKM